MPQILEDCVSKVIAKGIPEDRAWALCKTSIGMSKKDEPEEAYIDRVMSLYEELKKNAMETFDLVGLEVFAEGKWNGDEYNQKDLDEMVKAFQQTKDKVKPYLKIGHGTDQSLLRDDELPAAGYITNLYRQGTKLLADVTKVPKKIYDLIRVGAYSRVSAEIYWNISILGRTFKRMLKAVALLGAEMPAVTDLKGIMDLYSLAGDAGGLQPETEPKVYSIGRTDLAKEATMDELEQVKASLADSEKKLAESQAKVKEYEDRLSKMESEKESGQAQIKTLSEKMAALETENRKREVETKIHQLIKDGKVLPAQEKQLFELLIASNGSEEKIYSFLSAGPKVGLPTQEHTETGKGQQNDLDALTRQYMEKHEGASYKDALIAVSRETGLTA